MSRQPLTTRFPSLDSEPKGAAAPPAYRTLTNTASSDSWSMGSHDKRKSWTGLVDSNENLSKYRVNHYPRVHQEVMQRQTYFGSACQLGQVSSAPLAAHRGNASMTNMSDIVTFAMPKGPYPLHADPAFIPASGGGSYPPSESIAPLPQPDHRPDVPAPSKRNRLQEWKTWCCRPRMTMMFFVAISLLIIAAIIVIVVTQVHNIPTTLSMMWQAPAAYRGGQAAASQIDVNGESTDRIRFQMRGAAPFKGNFIAYYDFKTGKSVIVDESLKKNGEQFTCFLMPINISNTPNYDEMLKAASRAKSRIAQTEGWDEEWSVEPSPISGDSIKNLFNPQMPECENARWVQLGKTPGDKRNQKCTECHDFCLPEFGIQGQSNEGYLNIVRRNCFNLFVPEWRSYAQANTMEQNQRDFEAFYRTRQAQYGDSAGSKWIPLAGMKPSSSFGPASIPTAGVSMQQVGQQSQQQQISGYGNVIPITYGINQQPPHQQLQLQPGSFQEFGVQPGQHQGTQSTGIGNANLKTLYHNGVAGIPQQMANTGQSAISTIGSTVSDFGQGISNIYNSLQQNGAQAVDQFGNGISNAQQSVSSVMHTPQSGTGSTFGLGGYVQRPLGYGSGAGTANANEAAIEWQRSQQQQPQITYPGGFLPQGLKSTALEAGIPGVNNPQYHQNGSQQQPRMGDVSGYAPNVLSTSNGGLQQNGSEASHDSRQIVGVIGMPASSQTPALSSGLPVIWITEPTPTQRPIGYRPDVSEFSPSNSDLRSPDQPRSQIWGQSLPGTQY